MCVVQYTVRHNLIDIKFKLKTMITYACHHRVRWLKDKREARWLKDKRGARWLKDKRGARWRIPFLSFFLEIFKQNKVHPLYVIYISSKYITQYFANITRVLHADKNSGKCNYCCIRHSLLSYAIFLQQSIRNKRTLMLNHLQPNSCMVWTRAKRKYQWKQ